jgi:hypothetical protein
LIVWLLHQVVPDAVRLRCADGGLYRLPHAREGEEMRGVFQLSKFTVVVWVRKTANYQAIRDELLELAVEDPYESTE